MTIRNRLLAAFAAVVLLLGLPLAYGIGRLLEVREIAVALRGQQAEALESLGSLRTALAEFDRLARSYVISPDRHFREGLRAALLGARLAVRRLDQAGYPSQAEPAAIRLDSLAATATMLQALVEARRAQDATDYLRAAVQPTLVETQALLNPMSDAVNRSSTRAAVMAQDITAQAVRTATAAAALALLLGTAVALWAAITLVRPLRRLRASMATVANGTFVAGALPYDRNDEIGDLARSFRSMTDQLAELDRIRGEFLNVISHDLKAPLNLIGGCAELIEENVESLTPQQHDLLESIRRHVRLLTERINKLLSLGRLEARAYPVNPEDLPVAPTFEALAGSFEPQARRQGVRFSVEVEPTAPALVRVDPECLYHEVIGNLLSNAFKFTPTGGEVAVRVWGEQELLHFTVADSGTGIPPEKMPLVFSKYFQAGPPGSGSGAGLGLAIARQVVEAHGGSISVTNGQPSGAVFHVTLPAATARPEPPAAPRPGTRTRPTLTRREVVAGGR